MNRQTLILFQLQFEFYMFLKDLRYQLFRKTIDNVADLSLPLLRPHLSLSRLLPGWRGSWTIRYHFLTLPIHSYHTTPLVSLPYIFTFFIAVVLQISPVHILPLFQNTTTTTTITIRYLSFFTHTPLLLPSLIIPLALPSLSAFYAFSILFPFLPTLSPIPRLSFSLWYHFHILQHVHYLSSLPSLLPYHSIFHSIITTEIHAKSRPLNTNQVIVAVVDAVMGIMVIVLVVVSDSGGCDLRKTKDGESYKEGVEKMKQSTVYKPSPREYY